MYTRQKCDNYLVTNDSFLSQVRNVTRGDVWREPNVVILCDIKFNSLSPSLSRSVFYLFAYMFFFSNSEINLSLLTNSSRKVSQS